jgi:arylsulfatase A-like enzyme
MASKRALVALPGRKLAIAAAMASFCTMVVCTRSSAQAADPIPPPRPNIVYVLCDDLGYGDVHALNPERSRIATPNIDRLAAHGIAFTDAHSGSSVCTPTRYGILTGRYAWRTTLQAGVLQGMSPPLIARDRQTVAAFLRDHGYATAAIGKWHLGLTFGPSRWTDDLADGPLDHGFDEYFGISASLDMPPFAFFANRRVTEVPTVEKTWVRKGPAAASFEAVDVLPELSRRAVEYIAARGAAKRAANAAPPFFLYLSLTAPHTPIVPSAAWQGRSGLGSYADFVMQTDAVVGDVLSALEASGLADDTLVMFTSDNGCAPQAGVAELEAAGHFPSAGFRGYKADIWEGGHRIPLIVRWPGKVPAGSRSEALVCLTDLFATCADVLGDATPPATAEDSFSMLPHLLNQRGATVRESIVHHSIDGVFAIRRGRWKLALGPGSGGWAAPRDAAARKQGLPEQQLYDLEADPGEQHNVAAEHPEVVAALTELLKRIVESGRSTPGQALSNDAKIRVRKAPRQPADQVSAR